MQLIAGNGRFPLLLAWALGYVISALNCIKSMEA
jgi:hypothetical protein